MSALAGTGRLLRLALRRDRVLLASWVVALGALVAATIAAIDESYPDARARIARAVLSESPGTVIMTGPMFGVAHDAQGLPTDPGVGPIVVNELAMTVLLAVAVMSILIGVRHTRADEESGRTELLRALPTGRAAPEAAAMGVVAIANALVGVVLALALAAADLPMADSLAFGLACAASGLTFGAFAAVAAQLAEHAQSARSISLAVLGIAFLLRAIGDVDEPSGDSALSWLSPLAWAQQIRAYADRRLTPLLLHLALIVVLLAAAALLAARRDLGRGVLPERLGRERATAVLRSPFGLPNRLLTRGLVAWAIAIGVLGATFGSLAYAIQDMIEAAPELAGWIGGGDQLVEAYLALVVTFVAVGAGAVGTASMLRMHDEEDSGRLEHVIAFGAGRARSIGIWFAVAATGSAVVLVVGALGLGLGASAATGDASWTGRLVAAGCAYLPAALAITALAAALAGSAPSLTWIAWVVVGWTTLVAFLGQVLGLPEGLADLSPVELTPRIPAEDFEAAPIVALSAIAAALVAVALVAFRRRNLAAR